MKIIGATIGGDFRVVRQLARGTLARVYLASDRQSVKVLKLFPPHHMERAERELRMGRGLAHPHLNPVEAGVEIAGQPGVTMPYVHGAQLNAWLQQTDLARFLSLFVHVLEGLEYLHQRGIIHRDIKPENILVDTNDAPHLIDFDFSGPYRRTPSKERGHAGLSQPRTSQRRTHHTCGGPLRGGRASVPRPHGRSPL